MKPYEQIFGNVMRLGIYICKRGTCEITVNEKTFRLNPGDAFLRSPLLIVSSVMASEDFVTETIVEDGVEVFAPIASANFEILKNLLSNQVYHLSLSSAEQEDFLVIKRQIDAHEAISGELPPTSKRHALQRSIIVMLEQMAVLKYVDMYLSRNDSMLLESHKKQSTMMHFILLLFKNYKQHREVSFYADALHLSSGHFTLLIRKASGRTPSEWIAIVTINQAKRLLGSGSMSIKEVACELGFPEQFTFRKYFKLHTGLSPKAYAGGGRRSHL